MIAGSGRYRLTWQSRKYFLSFLFQSGAALPLGQPSQTEQDFASRYAAGDDAILGLHGGKPRGDSRILSHERANHARIEEK